MIVFIIKRGKHANSVAIAHIPKQRIVPIDNTYSTYVTGTFRRINSIQDNSIR